MKRAVLHVFSYSKVKTLNICLNTLKPKIPSLLTMQYVEKQVLRIKAMKTTILQGFSCFKVKILSICLKTLKPKIPTLLALQ